MSILNTAMTGLRAQQEALKTTGHNISNAGTPGYSRQEVVLGTNNPQFRGFGYIGQGVDVASVRRVTDQFMVQQQRADTTHFQQVDTFRANIEQTDRLLADEKTGLQPQLDRFFSSLQGGADNPAYIPSRDVVLGETQGLVDRFATIHKYLMDQETTVNRQLGATASQVNSLAEGIARLNETIVNGDGSPQDAPPNDLMDQRDELVRKLSELVEVDVTEDNQQYNVGIGGGRALVVGNQANRLEASASAENSKRTGIRFVSGTESTLITDRLTGGKMGGMLSFREEALTPAINSLGRIAVGVATEMNAQHRQGIDLNGNFGQNMFQDLNDPDLATLGRAQGSAENSLPRDQVMGVYFDDPSELTNSDYTLKMTGPEDFKYEITRKSDGVVVDDGSLLGDLPQEIKFDGLKLVLEGGSFKAGDSFNINPLRDVPAQLNLQLKDPGELAFAYPMRANASMSNEGTGAIDQGQMLSRESEAFAVDGELSPPLVVKFDSANRYSVYDNRDPGNPVPLEPPMENIEFIPGSSNTIFTDDPGETQVSSWRPRLPQDPTISDGGVTSNPPYNGINAEQFVFTRSDPQTGEAVDDPLIATESGGSAAAMANTLSQVDGVTARGYTEVQLANFTNSGTPYDPDNPFEVWVNGHEMTLDDLGPNQSVFMDGYPEGMPDRLNPNFLADRINAHHDLQAAGVSAKSDGETLTIMDHKGNDVLVEMRGDKPESGIVGSPPLGGGPINGGVDPGDTFEISTGEQWSVDSTKGNTRGQLNNLTGYDFSQGGPYEYEMYLPDGRKGTINLTGNHATADGVKGEIETKIQSQLDSPGRVEASITEKGEIRYQVFMKVAGTGNDDTAGVNIGGQVDVTMADGISMRTQPRNGAIFTDVPEAKSTYQGFQFQISGRPEAGDEFTIHWNQGGVSDNRNALDMVGLEITDTLNGRDGGMTFTEAYSQAVEQVGTKTRQMQIQTDAAEGVLKSTEKELNSVRGVNLDEEAALLIEFQLAYNANAQVIRIAQETFDSLMGAFR